MRKVYITRYGAVGDCIHASHLPRLLKQKAGFDYVAFEYNHKGFQVFQNNPFIDEHIHYEPSTFPICNQPISYLEKRWKLIKEAGGFEKYINLYRSLEYGYIAMEDQNEYYMSSEYRRERFGKLNYYDQTSIFAGYPEFIGAKGELYFTEYEENFVKKRFEDYKDNFVIICNLSGTSKHKIFYNAEGIIKKFLSQHPEAICITTGDKNCQEKIEFKGERIINTAGLHPFRESMLYSKYADMVIGCESGLMVAATLLGAAVIQLMTAASIKNHGGDFENDFSLQSPCYCSPCHKGPYEYIGCPTFEYLGLKYPLCIKFCPDVILERMEQVYDYSRERKKNSPAEMPALR